MLIETLTVEPDGSGSVRGSVPLSPVTVRAALDRVSVVPTESVSGMPKNTIGHIVFANGSEAWAVAVLPPDVVVRTIWPQARQENP